MATINQFDILEPFSQTNVNKLPHSIRLDKSIKEEGKFYRLLIGTLDIKNNITGEFIKQNTNYSILGKKIRDKFKLSLFTEPLSTSAKITDVSNYFSSTNPANIQLFRDLLNEFSFYYYYKHKGLHTLAFLHVYRILERMAYTFPMLYASKATDYIGTFNKLQGYFKGSNSELKFFNLFIESFFDSTFLDYEVKIDITAHSEPIREKYFKILKMLCTSNEPNIIIKDFTEFSSITIKNKDTINLMIHLRNRYFHFASGGQRNISSSEMIEPDDFYQNINEHFINWLAITYFEIAKLTIK